MDGLHFTDSFANSPSSSFSQHLQAPTGLQMLLGLRLQPVGVPVLLSSRVYGQVCVYDAGLLRIVHKFFILR